MRHSTCAVTVVHEIEIIVRGHSYVYRVVLATGNVGIGERQSGNSHTASRRIADGVRGSIRNSLELRSNRFCLKRRQIP